MTITRLLQGAVFGFVFAGTALPEAGKRPVISTLLLVLGILLLTTAYKKLQGGDDPDAPPPKWLTLIDQATPLKALGIGLGLPLVAAKLWVFTLSALATISAAQLGQPSSTIAFFLFILFAESLLILPIIFRIVMPVRSKNTLAHFSAWLNQNNRAIVIVVSFVFGLWFLYSGISGLI
jgi:hypothetical protein